MSSSISNITCPKCGGNALSEQDAGSCEIHIWCTEKDCDYDSDLNNENDEDGETPLTPLLQYLETQKKNRNKKDVE